MTISRRKFVKDSSQISAGAFLGGSLGINALKAYSVNKGGNNAPTHPNILLIMVDQMQTPPEGYRSDEGAAQGLKEILGFRPLSANNEYTRFFPGLMRLRQNAVVLKKHHTSTSASVPSRTCMLTGQYPNVTGVDQTNGMYKYNEDVPWLDPNGAPTLGHWFRAAGYKTYYYGKWHVSEPKEPDWLDPWGFLEWERSDPEPHGGNSDNSATYRDIEFTDMVVDFLENKARQATEPWFVVGSLVNPHDCGIWPINWQTPSTATSPDGTGVVPWIEYPPPVPIPFTGQKSRPGGVNDTHTIDLNPDGFPQNNSTLPRTYYESLNTKPRCQKDYSYKFGLACEANTNLTFQMQGSDKKSPHPFQLQGQYAEAWSLGYNQFYFYLQYLADLQIRRILQALDANDLTNNTIVVFLSDHGDMTSAHGGMIQKWHSAYEEVVRVPMVISSPLVNENKQEMREITQPTSLIDFAPTMLSLAGFDEDELRPVLESQRGTSVRPFAGANLSSLIKGESQGPVIGPDGNARAGVFFICNDTVTECGTVDQTPQKYALYDAFIANVDKRVAEGVPIVAGPVRQPNYVRAFCTGDWKIVKYIDPKEVEKDEWELYCLRTDPVEENNLVNFATGEVNYGTIIPGMTTDQIRSKCGYLKIELAKYEAVATAAPKITDQPLQLLLLQNYPNPFSQKTTIPFYVPSYGKVRLSIMDISGKEIHVLLNRKMEPGSYKHEFYTNGLPGGIYLVSLKSGSQQRVKKMTLIN